MTKRDQISPDEPGDRRAAFEDELIEWLDMFKLRQETVLYRLRRNLIEHVQRHIRFTKRNIRLMSQSMATTGLCWDLKALEALLAKTEETGVGSFLEPVMEEWEAAYRESDPEPTWEENPPDMFTEADDEDRPPDLFRDMGITDKTLSEELLELGASLNQVVVEQIKGGGQ